MPTIKKRGYASPKQQEQEILTIAHTVSSALSPYRKAISLALAIIAAVVVIGAVYSIVRSQQEQKASPLVAAAFEAYGRSGAAGPDYQKALELFRDVRKKYPNTVSGAIAQYYAGNCLVNLGHPDQAVAEYESFLKAYDGQKFLLGLVYQRLGYTYKNMGRQDDAIKAFEKAETLNGPGAATVEVARLYEASGNVPEAQKKYKEVLEKLQGTSWAMEVMSRVQKVESASVPAGGKGAK